MIQITPQPKILLAIEPADFRRQIDGLLRMCREELGSDPMDGTVFVFRNRRANAISSSAGVIWTTLVSVSRLWLLRLGIAHDPVWKLLAGSSKLKQ